ncbi:autotransporter translocation and assembly factor TamB [Bradyrhizobium sp. USDA 3311]
MADPITGSLILSGIGAGVSAAGTIAGGANAAALGQSQQNEANYQAAQIRENASSEIGAAQRQMLDTQQKTRLAQSTLTASAAGSGFVASVGSPEAISESIARRGTYEAAMQLFQGENAATGDLNKAAGVEMSGKLAAEGGQMQEEAADFSAIGNLASAGGSMFKNYSTMKTGSTGATAYG